MSHIADITLTAVEAQRLRTLLTRLEDIAMLERDSTLEASSRYSYLTSLCAEALGDEQELMHRMLTAGVVDD